MHHTSVYDPLDAPEGMAQPTGHQTQEDTAQAIIAGRTAPSDGTKAQGLRHPYRQRGDVSFLRKKTIMKAILAVIIFVLLSIDVWGVLTFGHLEPPMLRMILLCVCVGGGMVGMFWHTQWLERTFSFTLWIVGLSMLAASVVIPNAIANR